MIRSERLRASGSWEFAQMDHSVAAAAWTTGTESLGLGLGFGVPSVPDSLGLGRNLGDPPRPGRIGGRLQRQKEPSQPLQPAFGGMPQAIVADLVKPLRQDVHQGRESAYW